MVSCNKIVDISYYMSEASPVISDEIDIGHIMLCKRGTTSQYNKIMDIMQYIIEASQVISDEVNIGHIMLCKRGIASYFI